MAPSIGAAQGTTVTGVGRPLDWDEIEAYLVEVGAELERRGLVRSVLVVGGAYVASRGVRASTIDVDTISELDAELKAAVATVAERHGLELDWLNDRARPWRPVTFEPEIIRDPPANRWSPGSGPASGHRCPDEDLRRRSNAE